MSLCRLAMIGMVSSIAFATDPEINFKAKTFQFNAGNASLREVVDELTKQTGIVIDTSGATLSRDVQLSCKDVQFWDALEQIANASDHQIQFGDKGRALGLVDGKKISPEMPVSIDRAFRISARRVQSTINLESGQRTTEVTLGFACEPGVPIFLIDQLGKSVTARDNLGRQLQVIDPGKGRTVSTGCFTELQVRLRDVPRDSKSIALLEGHFGIVGAARMLDFSFDHPVASKDDKEPRSQTKEGITVKVETVFAETMEHLWTVRVEMDYPFVFPNFESFEGTAWLSQNSATLFSTTGDARLQGGNNELKTHGRETVLRYCFNNKGSKLRNFGDSVIHIRTPSRLIETDVQFKLKDIPLP